MRMLSDDEMKRVLEIAHAKTAEWLRKVEEDAVHSRKAEIEKRKRDYQSALEYYAFQMKQYEQQLEGSKNTKAIFERSYQCGLQHWKEYEQKKAEVEKEYQSQLAEYEKLKQEQIDSGEPFEQPPPQKKYLVPVNKPQRIPLYEPTLPTPPQMPELDIPLTIKIPTEVLLSASSTTKECFSSFANKQLKAIGNITPENKQQVSKIVLHEMFIQERLKMETANTNDTVISDGLYGEMLIAFELEYYICEGIKGVVLHNLEIAIGNRTIQTDIVFVTPKGVLVIESKNFSGKVSGAEHMKKWVLQTFKKQYNFYNPIMQNQSHIHALNNLIPNTRFYSLIVFSDRSYLDYIDIHCQDTFVFNLYALRDVIDDIFSNDEDCLSDQDMDLIVEKLKRYCADDSESNPDFKESRSYFSSRSKAKPFNPNPYWELPPFQIDDYIIE